MRGTKPTNFFSKEEQEKLVAAIRDAEQNSSGEIRIHVLRGCDGQLFEKGKEIFERLGMTRTRERNGILFLLELKNRRFAILGDKGIHEKVPPDFWEEIRGKLWEHFREGRFVEGLCAGIERCGEKLRAFFPHRPDDKNEVSDEITAE